MNDSAQLPTQLPPVPSATLSDDGVVGAAGMTSHPTPQVNPPQPPVLDEPAPQNEVDLPETDKMDLFESVLDEVETVVGSPTPMPSVESSIIPQGSMTLSPGVDGGVLPQALPMAVAQATAPLLNPAAPGTNAKERPQAAAEQTADNTFTDAGGVQTVEQERTPEIPPEVEAYMQKVQDHADQAPQEVVIADGTQESATTPYPSRPVVVLPITPEVEKEGLKKGPLYSIRWLIEWSHKIIKMFAGKVIYRDA